MNIKLVSALLIVLAMLNTACLTPQQEKRAVAEAFVDSAQKDMTERRMRERFGLPIEERTVKRNELVESFYDRINYLYPYSDERFHNVMIKELTWDLGHDENMTCWLHMKAREWHTFECRIWFNDLMF